MECIIKSAGPCHDSPRELQSSRNLISPSPSSSGRKQKPVLMLKVVGWFLGVRMGELSRHGTVSSSCSRVVIFLTATADQILSWSRHDGATHQTGIYRSGT